MTRHAPSLSRRVLPLAALLATLGCERPAEPTLEPPPSKATRAGGVAPQGLSMQGVMDYASLYPELAAHPLAPETFADVPSLAQAIRSPQAQGLVGYLVRGGFDPDRTLVLQVDGEELVYEGGLGLASEWATRPCDVVCQEWMSAYMGASINAYGVHVLVSYRPSKPDIITTADDEAKRFSLQEGAFFGNLFLPEPTLYVCRGAGYDPFYMTFRVCAQDGSPCFMRHLGACGAFDGALAGPSPSQVCDEASPELFGAFPRCRDRAGADPVDGATTYERVITLFLKEAEFVKE